MFESLLALLPALLLLIGLGGLGVVKGNVGAQSFQSKAVQAGGHLGPVLSLPIAADVGALEAGEVLGVDADGKLTLIKPEDVVLGVGDGEEADFAGTLGGPVEPRTVSITDGTSTLTDDGSGRLYGDGTGTVNYVTGAVSATFGAAPAAADEVTASAYREIGGVLSRDADSERDSIAPVVVHGTVIRQSLLENGAAVTNPLMAALRRRGIYAA